jgi:hypothetical protein
MRPAEQQRMRRFRDAALEPMSAHWPKADTDIARSDVRVRGKADIAQLWFIDRDL